MDPLYRHNPGAILTLGLSGQQAGQAMLLTSGYALGMGIPFLLLGLMFDRATRVVHRLRRHLRKIEIVSGLLLIGMGILSVEPSVVLDQASGRSATAYWMRGLTGTDAPTYFVAILVDCCLSCRRAYYPSCPLIWAILADDRLSNLPKPELPACAFY